MMTFSNATRSLSSTGFTRTCAPQVPVKLRRFRSGTLPYLPEGPFLWRDSRPSEREIAAHHANVSRLYRSISPYLSQVRRFNVGEDAATAMLLDIALAFGFRDKRLVADLCCGYGESVGELARAGHHVVGLDLCAFHVTSAHRNPSTVYVAGDAARLPFRDDSFECIWSEDSFSHVPDRRRLLLECFRVLKKDGLLVFSDLIRTDRLSRTQTEAFCRSWCLAELETASTYKQLLPAAGLIVNAFHQPGTMMVGEHERRDADRGDASYEEYRRWLLDNRETLERLWGYPRYRAQRARLLMYPYLRSGRLDYAFVVARKP